jgi:hypothetical protein
MEILVLGQKAPGQKIRAGQAAERFLSVAIHAGFVSVTIPKSFVSGAIHEGFVKGHDFSRAARAKNKCGL